MTYKGSFPRIQRRCMNKCPFSPGPDDFIHEIGFCIGPNYSTTCAAGSSKEPMRQRPGGRVAIQRIANPSTAVRLRSGPPISQIFRFDNPSVRPIGHLRTFAARFVNSSARLSEYFTTVSKFWTKDRREFFNNPGNQPFLLDSDSMHQVPARHIRRKLSENFTHPESRSH